VNRGASGQVVRLLEADPELGLRVPPSLLSAARQSLTARVLKLDRGTWPLPTELGRGSIGMLVLDGLLARDIILAGKLCTELLGDGDVVQAGASAREEPLVHYHVSWQVLEPVQIALLDDRFARTLMQWPQVTASMFERAMRRTQRMAVHQAILQLSPVETRLLVLFWHLAERWGRVARDGIAVPLVLSHRLIGELVGARRPTVSTALADLARDGQLVRRHDGTWLLTGEPVSVPAVNAAEVVRQRRHLVPAAREPEPEPEPEAVTAAPARLLELRSSLEAAREIAERNREALDVLQEETASLRARTVELRERRVKHVGELRAAASRRREG
jgi:CRP/FNR family cyclic AMP-dependent transcriptional regulator